MKIIRFLTMIAAASAAAALGGAAFEALDIVNHFAPFSLAACAGVAALAWRRRSRWAGWIAGAAAFVHASLIVPDLAAAARPRPPPEANDLRIASLNMWGRNPVPAHSGAYLAAQNLDVAAVQETGLWIEPLVAATQPSLPHRTNCHGRLYGCSPTLLARRAFVAPGRPICNIATMAQIDGGALGAVTVIGVHLSRPWPAGRQTAEIACLTRAVAHMPPRRTILVGDFNATPSSFALRRADAALPGFTRVTHALATWPAPGSQISNHRVRAPFAALAIDHVYLSRDLVATSVRRGQPIGSDHLPVIVTLRAGEDKP